jgi:hypothetical protein
MSASSVIEDPTANDRLISLASFKTSFFFSIQKFYYDLSLLIYLHSSYLEIVQFLVCIDEGFSSYLISLWQFFSQILFLLLSLSLSSLLFLLFLELPKMHTLINMMVVPRLC